MNGLELAVALKKIKPDINIIFATAYVKYKGDAMDLRASGYVMKPVTKEAVEREIENLRHPVDRKALARVYVQTFGNFEVFVDGRPIIFKREKAKESFAYLIDRRGAFAKTAEIAAAIWEDRDYNRSLQNQTQVVISAMMQTLKENGIEDVIIKKWNALAVDDSKIVCDYYNLQKLQADAVNAYEGEYMNNYSWAEMTTAFINKKISLS